MPEFETFTYDDPTPPKQGLWTPASTITNWPVTNSDGAAARKPSRLPLQLCSARGAKDATLIATMAFEPHQVAQRGKKIYERVRRDFEANHPGAFVIIDLNTERVVLGDSPEAAYREARAAHLTGPFHLLRVGHAAVYRTTRPQWRRRTAG